MSPLGRVMTAFPAVFVLLVLGLGWWCPPVGLAVLYLLPPLLYRLHERLFPLREGLHRLVGATYVPWWGGECIGRRWWR